MSIVNSRLSTVNRCGKIYTELKITEFEDIIAWNKAQDLAEDIQNHFERIKNPSFRNQINSAAVSISNNIAEGFERSSDKDFMRFLYIALGSCSEVKSMLYLAQRFKYISDEKAASLRDNCKVISKLIRGLINSIKRMSAQKQSTVDR